MRTQLSALIIAMATGMAGTAFGQQIQPPSRTVYRCETGGKVAYSDEPCPAARRLEIEPTRGLTTTGKERAGADVQREFFREQLSDAVRPITGMNSKQFDVASKRVKLSAEAQGACKALDLSIPRAEAVERQANGAGLAAVQSDLLLQRKKFRDLRC